VVARQIDGRHAFKGVWVVHLDGESISAGRYSYFVSELYLGDGNAPVFRVDIADDFGAWDVVKIQ
jgi:hypothetical protein